MSHIETPAGDLQARVSATLAALREEIVATLAEGEQHLRAVDVVEHDRPGWYGVVHALDLRAMGYPVQADECVFPVPPECPWWHEAEEGGPDLIRFRFFARHAWLNTSFAPGRHLLKVVVPHAVSPEARDSLHVSINGIQRVARRSYDSRGRLVLSVVATFTGRDELRFDCDVAGVPARMYPGSTDTRLLSVAIGIPTICAVPHRRFARSRRSALIRRCIHR